MQTILVPVGGSAADDIVAQTALAAARPFAAHLRFLHIHVGAAEAAQHTPHMAFARGQAIGNALARLMDEADKRSVAAERHVRVFCARHGIEMADKPAAAEVVTASWRQEQGGALERLMLHARHSDLIVVARCMRADGLPPDRLEALLMDCGRPLLIAGQAAPAALSTIMVCWKETAEAARALTAAMPLLRKAKRIALVAVKEGDEDIAQALTDLSRQMQWHGVQADPRLIASDGRPAAEVLASAAKECGADLLVMGGYGHSRARELLFGGCTQAVIEGFPLPVFLLH